MPPALTRVEDASVLLIEASDMLRGDPYSASARKKLIEGSRGIAIIIVNVVIKIFSICYF